MPSRNELLENLRMEMRSRKKYEEVNHSPTQGEELNKTYDAVLLASASNDLDFVDGTGESTTVPSGALTTGEIIPIEVQKIESTTSISESDIVLLNI